MVDVAVTLPEPRPNDDEDVVWGLSTAAALWARGERGDAIVWLRRAAETAASAGQEARASELLWAVAQLEQALEAHVSNTMPLPPPPHRAAAETLPELRVSQPPDRVSLGIEVELEPATPAPAPVVVMPPVAAEPPASASAPTLPRPPSVRPPPAPKSVAPPPQKPPPSSAQPPSITPAPGPAPTIVHPASVAPPPPPPPRARLPSYTFLGQKPSPRAPILDPWAEEQPASAVRVEPPRQVQVEGDEVMVQMRRPSQPRGAVVDDDEDVVTSAAPLAVTLRKATKPPPARKVTATGEQPPGHIADAPVPAKSGNRPPPPPQRAPSSDASKAAPASTPPPAPEPPSRPAVAPPPPAAPPAAAPPAVPRAAATLPSMSPVESPTLPSAPSPIARAKTAPPPAAPTVPAVPRVPTVPTPSAPASSARPPSPSSIRLPPPSVRPPPPSATPASVRPPAPVSLKALIPSVPRPAAPPAPAPASRRPPSVAPPPPAASAISLDGVATLADLEPAARAELATRARVELLAADEEVKGFGAALLLEGSASVYPAIVDTAIAAVTTGTLVTTRGTAGESIALRVVAGPVGAQVAVWDAPVIDAALDACPWVQEELTARANRLQALAGAVMGPFGDLDDDARARIFDRMRARVVRPREVIVAAGAPLAEVMLVCAGAVEADDDEDGALLVRPGEVLFPLAVREGGACPSTACAAAVGAILLVGDRALFDELAALPALAAAFAT